MGLAIPQSQRFPRLELEAGGEQVLHAVEFPADTFRAMPGGIGKDMVELMRQHAAQCPAESLQTLVRPQGQELPLKESANGIAIHIGKREDNAVADMGPTQRAGVGMAGKQSTDVAAAFKVDDGQFYGDLASL